MLNNTKQVRYSHPHCSCYIFLPIFLFCHYRVEGEEKRKQGKQQKRSENLGKRKTDKKEKQKKQAIKKGRVVPGFR